MVKSVVAVAVAIVVALRRTDAGDVAVEDRGMACTSCTGAASVKLIGRNLLSFVELDSGEVIL